MTRYIMHPEKEKFLYFAYGSNLLTDRIRINNPSALKITTGILKDYRLDFNLYGHLWRGAAATVIPERLSHVWGVIWEIENSDMENLDKQECGYDPITVVVDTADGRKLECRSYQVNAPLVDDRRPSLVYKNVILKGAMEHHLPETYIQQLRQIQDNGYNGPVDLTSLRNG